MNSPSPFSPERIHQVTQVTTLMVAAVLITMELGILFGLSASISMSSLLLAWCVLAIFALTVAQPARAWAEWCALDRATRNVRRVRAMACGDRERHAYETTARIALQGLRWHWLSGLVLTSLRWGAVLVFALCLLNGNGASAVAWGKAALVITVLECIARETAWRRALFQSPDQMTALPKSRRLADR